MMDLSPWYTAVKRNEAKNERNYCSHLTDEAALIKKLRALDPQAITSIHRSYYSHVYRYAHYRVGDPIVAEDLASEAFTRLLEAAKNRRGPRTHIRGWLMGTISNLINDHYRAFYRQPLEQIQDNLETEEHNPDQNFEVRELEHQIRYAIQQLSPLQQHVLALRFGNGYSLEETAEIMGKKVNAIKQLQFRAVAAMRRNMVNEE